MKKVLHKDTAFTEDHSRALMINALVEFNLIPPPVEENKQIIADILAGKLLPSEGDLSGLKKANCRNLLTKMSEWPCKKSLAAQQECYQELARLSNLKVELLTPPYLTQRREQKLSLQSLAAVTIGNVIMSNDDSLIAQEIVDGVQVLGDGLQKYIFEQCRMFARREEDYTDCVVEDTITTDAQAVATLVANIRSNINKDLYFQLHLILAKIVGREDFVELLEMDGYTLQKLPDDLVDRYGNQLVIEFDEPTTISDQQSQNSM